MENRIKFYPFSIDILKILLLIRYAKVDLNQSKLGNLALTNTLYTN